MEIKSIVEKLMRKYDTNNPFKLPACLNIFVQRVRHENTWGYYLCYRQLKAIYIDCDLPEALQHHTCTHEIGYAILHKSISTPFLKKLSVDKIERQQTPLLLNCCCRIAH